MTEKVTGYTFLAVGIMVILYACFSMWSVFTKQSKPVALFNLKGISIDMSQVIKGNLPPEAQQALKPNKQEIIPAETLNQSSDIFAHLLFMGFLVSVGAKLATIGTQLVRPIEVKLRTTESTSSK